MKAAQAAVKAKGTYFKDRFQRLQARRGVKRALLAIAQELLRCATASSVTGSTTESWGTATSTSLTNAARPDGCNSGSKSWASR